MSKRRGRRRPTTFSLGRVVGGLTASPMRAAVLAGVGLFLGWVVLIKSLPAVFVSDDPELALQLDPGHPVALLALANRARAELLALVVSEAGANAKANSEAGQEAASADSVVPEPDTGERERLRAQIRELALRVIAVDPLNARAFRLLGEVTEDPERVRVLMREAAKRSRREATAVFWLLHDSFSRQDYASALGHADIVMRTRVQLFRYVMSYLGQIAETDEGQALLVRRLADDPGWRRNFFLALADNVKDPNTPLRLMLALKGTDKPATDFELKPYLALLIRKGQVGLAYNAWLQLFPVEQLSAVGLLHNASFETDPSGLPFDWQIPAPLNAVVEVVPMQADAGRRALHISFGVGRVKFPPVSQVITLGPGRYRLEGKFRGKIVAKRGLRWRFSCLYGRREVVAETEMLQGQALKWRSYSVEVEVPDDRECRAQTLSLVHDARSASEELISGEVWFDDLQLERVED